MKFSGDVDHKRWSLCVVFSGNMRQHRLFQLLRVNTKKELFPPGFEPGTFRVWGERDNHYTTETVRSLALCTRVSQSSCAHWPPDVSSIAWPYPTILNTGHHFGDPLSFSLASPGGEDFTCDICEHVFDGLAQNLVQTFMVPRQCILKALVILWLFL